MTTKKKCFSLKENFNALFRMIVSADGISEFKSIFGTYRKENFDTVPLEAYRTEIKFISDILTLNYVLINHF